MGRTSQNHQAVKAPRCAALRLQCLTAIATELELLRANNEGKIPDGSLSQIVIEYKESFPWINKDMVQNHIRKLNKLQKDTNLIEEENEMINTELSFLQSTSTINTSSLSDSMDLDIQPSANGEEEITNVNIPPSISLQRP
jgi:hypothetical protein